MKNQIESLVNKIENQKAVKDFGITEAYFYKDEFFTSSNYGIPYHIIESIELQLRSIKYTTEKIDARIEYWVLDDVYTFDCEDLGYNETFTTLEEIEKYALENNINITGEDPVY